MKFNWRVYVAAVVIIVVIGWAVNSVRSLSYSGANPNFHIGSGPVTVTNPSDAPVAAQLLGTGSRIFSVSSKIEGVAGSSTRQPSGSPSSQLFEFSVPPGVTVFTVGNGTNVSFVSKTDTKLQATVEPLSQNESRTTIIVAFVVVAGALFYISRATGHRWIGVLRGNKPAEVIAAPVVEAPVGDPNRGRDGRMYSNYGSKD